MTEETKQVGIDDFLETAKKHDAVPLDTTTCNWVNGIYVCDMVGARIALTKEQFDLLTSKAKE